MGGSRFKGKELGFLKEVGVVLPWQPRLGRVNKHDFNSVVTEFLREHGGSMEEVLVDIFQCLMLASRCGDTNAARILLDRFCGKDAEQVDVNLTETTLTPAERQARIEAIMAKAALRVVETRVIETKALTNDEAPGTKAS